MVVNATWLVDKSAYVRLPSSPDGDEWAARIERGLVLLSPITRLELGFSARSADELRADFLRPPLAWMPIASLTPAIEDRAFEVQALLAERGQHRSASIADLIVAATAELLRFTVLHVDKDFELIAEVTGQAIERLTVA